MRHLGFAALVAVFFVANHFWGPIGVTRLMGCWFMAYGTYACFVEELPFHLGGQEIARLHGWHKAWVLAPLLALGLAFVTYAPAITCASSRYEHLCK